MGFKMLEGDRDFLSRIEAQPTRTAILTEPVLLEVDEDPRALYPSAGTFPSLETFPRSL